MAPCKIRNDKSIGASLYYMGDMAVRSIFLRVVLDLMHSGDSATNGVRQKRIMPTALAHIADIPARAAARRLPGAAPCRPMRRRAAPVCRSPLLDARGRKRCPPLRPGPAPARPLGLQVAYKLVLVLVVYARPR